MHNTSGVANSGTLNFDCSALKWSSKTLTTQAWVGQNYMFNNSPTLNGSPIVSYTNASCYIQCLSTQNNDWTHFHANYFSTDAQILCTTGTSNTAYSGNLNFYCAFSVFNCSMICPALTANMELYVQH